VFDEIAQGHGATVIRALSLQRVPLHLVAKRVDRLTSGAFHVHPLFAAFRHEIAAQILTPAEVLGQRVIGPVPAGVLHQR